MLAGTWPKTQIHVCFTQDQSLVSRACGVCQKGTSGHGEGEGPRRMACSMLSKRNLAGGELHVLLPVLCSPCCVTSQAVVLYPLWVKQKGMVLGPCSNTEWNEECLPAFDLPFIVPTDGSNLGLRVVLSQRNKGVERVIAFANRGLRGFKRNNKTIAPLN